MANNIDTKSIIDATQKIVNENKEKIKRDIQAQTGINIDKISPYDIIGNWIKKVAGIFSSINRKEVSRLKQESAKEIKRELKTGWINSFQSPESMISLFDSTTFENATGNFDPSLGDSHAHVSFDSKKEDKSISFPNLLSMIENKAKSLIGDKSSKISTTKSISNEYINSLLVMANPDVVFAGVEKQAIESYSLYVRNIMDFIKIIIKVNSIILVRTRYQRTTPRWKVFQYQLANLYENIKIENFLDSLVDPSNTEGRSLITISSKSENKNEVYLDGRGILLRRMYITVANSSKGLPSPDTTKKMLSMTVKNIFNASMSSGEMMSKADFYKLMYENVQQDGQVSSDAVNYFRNLYKNIG